MPDYNDLPRFSISEEVLAFTGYTDETVDQLIDTRQFKKLLFDIQKTDVTNPIEVESSNWTSSGNAVDANFSTSTTAATASIDRTIVFDFGSIASRVLNIDWLWTETGIGVGDFQLETSDDDSAYTVKLGIYTAGFGRRVDVVASHSFRYARVTLDFISSQTVTAEIYEIWDPAATPMGGTVTSTLQRKNEQNNDWINFATVLSAYNGASDATFQYGELGSNADILFNSASLVRLRSVFTGALKTGIQVVKVA